MIQLLEEVQEEKSQRRFREGEDLGDWGVVANIDRRTNTMTMRNSIGGTFEIPILTDSRRNQYIQIFDQNCMVYHFLQKLNF